MWIWGVREDGGDCLWVSVRDDNDIGERWAPFDVRRWGCVCSFCCVGLVWVDGVVGGMRVHHGWHAQGAQPVGAGSWRGSEYEGGKCVQGVGERKVKVVRCGCGSVVDPLTAPSVT